MAAAIPSLISWTFLLACLPAGRIAFFNIEYLFSFAVMPDARQSYLFNLVRRRHTGMPDLGVMPPVSRPAPACQHAGRGSHALFISSSAGMPACRTWESCPLYLVLVLVLVLL